MGWRLASLLAITALTACAPQSQIGGTAAYRYQSGGALGRIGVGSGGTGSIYLSDRGGPISRALMFLAELMLAPGAFRDVQTTTYVDDTGDAIVVHRETTATVDLDDAAALAKLAKLTTDPDVSFAERHAQGYSGITGSVEIASRNLGGDTSGWMLGLGYEHKSTGTLGFELAGKIGVGSFTLHGRTLTGYDDVTAAATTTMGDSTAPFFGLNLRAGVVYTPPVRATYGAGIEAFVAPDLNLLAFESDDKDPTQNTPASVWRAGLRLTAFSYAYLEATYAFSAFVGDRTSYGLEVGFAL